MDRHDVVGLKGLPAPAMSASWDWERALGTTYLTPAESESIDMKPAVTGSLSPSSF